MIAAGIGMTESLYIPRGDANKTNTSQSGFNLAADSIAQACLEITKWYFYELFM